MVFSKLIACPPPPFSFQHPPPSLPLIPPFRQTNSQLSVHLFQTHSPFSFLPGSLNPSQPAIPFTGRRGLRGGAFACSCCFTMLRPSLQGPPNVTSEWGVWKQDPEVVFHGMPQPLTLRVSLWTSDQPSMLPVGGAVRPLP